MSNSGNWEGINPAKKSGILKRDFYTVARGARRFQVSGRLGDFSVYLDHQCLIFGMMTKGDAENWIWSNYPAEG